MQPRPVVFDCISAHPVNSSGQRRDNAQARAGGPHEHPTNAPRALQCSRPRPAVERSVVAACGRQRRLGRRAPVRDLVGAYSAQLGERMQREDVRALVGSLVSLTLISERLQADVANGEQVDPNHVIQVAQTIVRLLKELGVTPAASNASISTIGDDDNNDAAHLLRTHCDAAGGDAPS
jgi:hypothetical protein